MLMSSISDFGIISRTARVLAECAVSVAAVRERKIMNDFLITGSKLVLRCIVIPIKYNSTFKF